ncbi:MAG: GNAT family N-acetyltransferase [Pseudomonadota bacterium]
MKRSDRRATEYPVERCSHEYLPLILEMYDTFFPEAVTQGLPPIGVAARTAWIGKLLDTGDNFVVRVEGRVIGHAALIPDMTRKDGEYLVFVGRPARKSGVGSALTRAAVKRAGELGLHTVWLTVDADNMRAVMLYRKFGFEFTDTASWERKMDLKI